LLAPLADDSGVSIVNYGQLTDRRLPLPVPLSPQLYTRQPIRMTCTGSYAAIVSFILRVEKKLPLVALEALSIKPQKEQPDIQTANIILEWPIKGENTADTAKGGVKK
jgi:Tfp pilus assembly protein PilO